MDKAVDLVIPEIIQYGALGLLLIFLVIDYIMGKTDNKRLTKKVIETQDKRIADAKDTNREFISAIGELKNKVSDLCIEVRTLGRSL